MAFIAPVFMLALAAPAQFPLTPEYVYNGIDRPFWVKVDAARSIKKLTIRLVKPVGGDVLEESEIKRGRVKLEDSLKSLWKEKRKEVLFAQLTGDGKPVGPALVLQPMTNPPVATLDATTKNPKWEPDEDNTFAGIRVWVNQNVLIETDLGSMEFKLRPDVAPNTVWNFVQLVAGGYYRDVIFHRIVQKGRNGGQFVAQAGDPTGTGMGSPGYAFTLEKTSLPHNFGVLGMARSTDPNTNGSQFYIALSREATQHLDGRYATFAECVKGQDVIKKIAAVEIGPKDDRPVKPPIIKNARLVNPS